MRKLLPGPLLDEIIAALMVGFNRGNLGAVTLCGLMFWDAWTTPGIAQAYRNPYGKLPAAALPGDSSVSAYFRSETEQLERRSLADFKTLDAWKSRRKDLQKELAEMLGLEPSPTKTDLRATITGTLDHSEFTVEKLHFQSRPGLYATANVYVPKHLTAPAPAILYVCGHGPVKTNGVSYGNKVAYQHHGIWFARNGYVCLVLDTVQLGEIEGIHHGTHREGMWWWNSRGYSSAGVEAWNCVRALDYLQSRKDVDSSRMGVTGRSGGGAYSWWVAALDERVRVACPVAGITDLRNHVVDGVVEGHCDCMFMVNTHRWDFPQLAALVAPRPLLIGNTDKDTIFPLDGVARVHLKTRAIYDLYGKPENLGLLITEGPHKDSQDLQVPVMRWFNKWLMNQSPLLETAAKPLFTPEQLKVFNQLPADEITSRCHEDFTVLASNGRPWDRAQAVELLRQKTFGGWPVESEAGSGEAKEVSTSEVSGVRFTAYDFESQPGVRLRFYLARGAGVKPRSVRFEVYDQTEWSRFLAFAYVPFGSVLREEIGEGRRLQEPVENGLSATAQASAQWIRQVRESGQWHVLFAPRGVGMSAMSSEARYQTHVRRRYMLLGQTLAGMQVWDLIRAVRAVNRLEGVGAIPVHLHPTLEMTEVATFASVLGVPMAVLNLDCPPRPDKLSPDFLNWRRIVTSEQLLELAASRCQVKLKEPGERR